MAIFTNEMKQRAEEIIARYPQKKSAVMPLLWLVQERHGYIPKEAIFEVAELIDVTPAHVEMIRSFYEMYHAHPVGKHIIHVCTNISCMLRGAYDVADYLKQKLGVDFKQTTPDGLFTLEEVECIAACCGAPAMLLDGRLVENVTPEKIERLIEEIRTQEGNVRGQSS